MTLFSIISSSVSA